MNQGFGMIRPELQALPQIKERLTFLYIERAVLNRQDNAITVTDMRGTAHIPAAAVSVLLLGPGTTISHRAMELIGDAGASVLWVGEWGVRFYSGGKPLTNSSRLMEAQAALVSNTRSRVSIARKLYAMRFPDENVSGLSMQQLRGREGSRVRSVYRRMSVKTGVPWNGREYNINDFNASDNVNKALSVAHSCLYGVIHSVINAIGCSPALGFIHSGHALSFVYDIADLYKAEVTIPIAFEAAARASENDDISAITRRSARDAMKERDILVRAVHDIRGLLSSKEDEIEYEAELLQLWDDKLGLLKSGSSYGIDSYDDVEENNEESYE